jgi:hypothetical protein
LRFSTTETELIFNKLSNNEGHFSYAQFVKLNGDKRSTYLNYYQPGKRVLKIKNGHSAAAIINPEMGFTLDTTGQQITETFIRRRGQLDKYRQAKQQIDSIEDIEGTTSIPLQQFKIRKHMRLFNAKPPDSDFRSTGSVYDRLNKRKSVFNDYKSQTSSFGQHRSQQSLYHSNSKHSVTPLSQPKFDLTAHSSMPILESLRNDRSKSYGKPVKQNNATMKDLVHHNY